MKPNPGSSEELDPRLSAALGSYAAELRATARVPSVENLLWKAALRERLAGSERAVRLGNQVRRAILAAGGLGVVIAAAIFRRPLFDFFSSIQGSSSGTSSSFDLTLATVALLSASGIILWLAELPGEKP